MTPGGDPIDFEAFENAIHAWFAESTGLATVWRDACAPQPPYPFGSLLLTDGPRPAAPQWEERWETDLGRPPGQENATEVCVLCTLIVSCQAHVGLPCSRSPGARAGAYLARAQTALSLPSYLEAFRAAGISVVRPGSILNIDEVVNDAFISRAALDVTFGAALSLTEFAGYLAAVRMRSTTLAIDVTVGGSP